jgi:DNA-binding GntR family transcriptional regulator
MQKVDITGVTLAIVEHLRIDIVEGLLSPGQKLNETEIASHLGTSRAPLREAFRILEGEELVTNTPRKGCCVREISLKACRDIFQIREMMECYAVDLIKENKITDFRKIESAILKHKVRKAPVESDPYQKYAYLTMIADFHIQLIESAENHLLCQFYKKNFPALARYQYMYTSMDDLMQESKTAHAFILELLKTRKYEQAKKEIRSHIQGFLILLEAHLKKNDSLSMQTSR